MSIVRWRHRCRKCQWRNVGFVMDELSAPHIVSGSNATTEWNDGGLFPSVKAIDGDLADARAVLPPWPSRFLVERREKSLGWRVETNGAAFLPVSCPRSRLLPGIFILHRRGE